MHDNENKILDFIKLERRVNLYNFSSSLRASSNGLANVEHNEAMRSNE